MAVKKGDKVKLDYEGKLDSGEVFDSSKKPEGHNHPLEFEVGSGKVIKGFDDAVMGMSVNEEKEFKIKPEEAYGPIRDDMFREVPREVLPKNGPEPKEGMILLMQPQGQEGQPMPVKITKVLEKTITIDLNHPLAGKNLTFKIKLLSIN